MDLIKIKDKVSHILCPFIYLITVGQQYIEPIEVYDSQKTIELLQSGASVGRFGDGEINIAMGKAGIVFQDMDDRLKTRLTRILEGTDDIDGFYIALPYSIYRYKGLEILQKRFWSIFLLKRRRWIYQKVKGRSDIFLNAFFPRFNDIYVSDRRVWKRKIYALRKIWKEKRCLIVEGRDTRCGVDNDLLYGASKICRLLVPQKNAFTCYGQIRKKALWYIGKMRADLVLLIAGPAATVLAFDIYVGGVFKR